MLLVAMACPEDFSNEVLSEGLNVLLKIEKFVNFVKDFFVEKDGTLTSSFSYLLATFKF